MQRHAVAERDQNTGDNDLRSAVVGLARSAAIRYSILLPKIKAASFFQPEDHVKGQHIKRGTSPIVGITHTAAIFAAGTALFVVQGQALKRLDPNSEGDFGRTTPLMSAISGGCGGAVYGLFATTTHAWLGTGDGSLQKQLYRNWAFLRRAAPYTIAPIATFS